VERLLVGFCSDNGAGRIKHHSTHTHIHAQVAVTGASWAALVVAIFSHAYIWVHYFCTERLDLKLIYG
jgi:hypothetical protein